MVSWLISMPGQSPNSSWTRHRHTCTLEIGSMNLPHFTFMGSAYDKGATIGRVFASRIRALIARNRQWESKQKSIPADLIHRVCKSFVSWCEKLQPSLLDEVQGYADGAGATAEDIIKMNANGEIRALIPDHSSGCTSFALDPAVAKNGPLSGQSKDGVGPLWKHYVILDTQCTGEPRILELGYPGYLGLLGLSETGVSLFTNRIYDNVETDGIPHIIVKKLIWKCRRVHEVEDLLAKYGTAIAANFLVCDKDGHAACFELRGDAYARVDPEDGILVHTNHYLQMSGGEDTEAFKAVCSRERRQRLAELFKKKKGKIGTNEIFRFYRDHRHHPRGICSHGSRTLDYGTTAVLTAEHKERMLSVTAGRTCRASYTTYKMGEKDPVFTESGASK